MHSRSGSILGGVSALLLSLANSLNRELRSPIQILAPLETALRNGKPAHLWGRQFPLDRHMRGVRSKTEGYVSDLVSRLGNHSDIPQIVIAGGGANLFYPALRAKFPVQTIATPGKGPSAGKVILQAADLNTLMDSVNKLANGPD